MLRFWNRASLLKESVFLVIATLAFFQVLALRGLYADGSFQLINLLRFENLRLEQQGGLLTGLFSELVTPNNEPSRFFAYMVTEGPTVLALRLGVTNLDFLTYLFSSGILLMPLLFWSIGLFKLRKDFLFWPYVMMFIVIYFMSNFFSIGEYNFCYGVAACCLALTLRTAPTTKFDNAFLVFSAISLTMSYPATAFLGPLLACCALWKIKHTVTKADRLFWSVLAILYLLAAAIGSYGILHPAHPDNFQQAHNYNVLYYNRQFWVVSIASCVIAINTVFGSRVWRDGVACGLLGLACFIVRGSFDMIPFVGYATRAFTGLLLFGFGLALFWIRLYGENCLAQSHTIKNLSPVWHSIVPICLILLALSCLDIKHSLQFRHYLNDYTNLINDKTGFLPYEESARLIPNNNIYGWSWTNPSLSLLLRKNAQAALVLDPIGLRTSWKPVNFDAGIPDMSRYGIR